MTAQNTVSIAELQQKAQAGDAQAQFDLALCYANGDGVEKDEVLAFEWNKKSAELGHVDAQFALGLFYFIGNTELQNYTLLTNWTNGKFINKNIDPAFDLAVTQVLSTKLTQTNHALAFKWLKTSAEKNYAEAQYYLALCYFEGKGVERNYVLAFEEFEKAAINNITEAQDKLARRYWEGNGVVKNEVLAFEWFKKAADADFAEAQFELSRFYTQGIGVEKNDILAFECLKKAAEQDIAEAQYLLAQAYEQGTTDKEDLKQAFEWYKKASKNEFIEAKYQLANCYYDGRGVEKNNDLAFTYYQEASQAGHALAKTKIGQMYCYTGLCIIFDKSNSHGYSEDDAFDFFTNSIEHGYLEAFREISKFYCIEFNKSYQRVINWYENYIELGYVEAGNLLAEICIQYDHFLTIGLGTEINQAVGFELLLKASKSGSEKASQKALLKFCMHHKFNNSDSERVFNGFKFLSSESDNIEIMKLANSFLSDCYAEGFGTDKNIGLAEYHSQLGLSHNELLDIQNSLLYLPPKSQLAKENLDEILGIFLKKNDTDSPKEFLEQTFENPKGIERAFKKVALMTVEQAEKLSKLNQELEEKNRQLQKAQHELEETMAMFAHKFRSPLDAIIYNTNHEHQPKLYIQAAQTMRGLLDIFTLISTDADKLQPRLKNDCRGNGNLTAAFSKVLDMVLLHLLSTSAKGLIRQHYLRYAKACGLCEVKTTSKQWYEDCREMEQQLQQEWEQSYAQLLNQPAALEQRLVWLELRFFKLELLGFARNDIQFDEYGITESLLTIVLNEFLVNAFKYYASSGNAPVVLEWASRDGHQVLTCRNPSTRHERTRIKGSGKGHVFLSALARKIGSEFIKPNPADDFVVEFFLADELLISN
jgi:TPR repeat protein